MDKTLSGNISTMERNLSGDISTGIISFEADLPGTPSIVIGAQGPQGPQGPPGKTPVKGVDYFTQDEIADVVEEVKRDISAGVEIHTDETLTFKDGILSVNTTDAMEQDNTLPITSAGVFATVGNIEALLMTI